MMNVSHSTAIENPEVIPSMIVPNLQIPSLGKREIESFLEKFVIFQQQKNPCKWTYFTPEEFAKSRGLKSLPANEKEILEVLTKGGTLFCPRISLSSGYMQRNGIYYHISGKLINLLKAYTNKALLN